MAQDTGRRPDGTIDPFHLFCTFHLGLTPAGLCRAADVSEAARRFDATPAEILKALEDNEMDGPAITESGYHLELAQMDIKVSPPGVSKMELAKGLYEEYLEARRQVGTLRKDIPEPDVELLPVDTEALLEDHQDEVMSGEPDIEEAESTEVSAAS